MLKLHVCQILYNPSYFGPGYDLLEEPAPLISPQGALGLLRSDDRVSSFLVESKGSYVRHVSEKIYAIAAWSAHRGANVLVLPEYSVPATLLPRLHALAQEAGLLISAGTHRIRQTESNRQAYKAISVDPDSLVSGNSVAPLLGPDGSVHMEPKLAPSKWEPTSELPPGEHRTYKVHFKDQSVRVAVLPCLDALRLDQIGDLWETPSESPQIVLCPSLSPTSELFRTSGAVMVAHETLFAYANSATYGGTTFNVPESWLPSLPGAADPYRRIPDSVEGILEIDFEPTGFFAKRGSVQRWFPCTCPRAFPIVYAHGNRWLEKYDELKFDVLELLKSNEVGTALEFIDQFLAEQDVPLPDHLAARVKHVRHHHVSLYAGDVRTVEDCLTLAVLGGEVPDSRAVYGRRISEALDLLMVLIKGSVSTESDFDVLLNCVRELKSIQGRMGLGQAEEDIGKPPLASSPNFSGSATSEQSERAGTRLARFQDRGSKLDELKALLETPYKPVIVITGFCHSP